MRAVVQRVDSASVTIDGKVNGKIGKGFMVLIGIDENDTDKDLDYICDKLTGLRIFEDEAGKMNRSIIDAGGEILLVSQFTLYGDARHGKRPSFIRAARPEKAIPLYELVISQCCERGFKVGTGEFGAEMKVESINDGPVTIILDTKEL